MLRARLGAGALKGVNTEPLKTPKRKVEEYSSDRITSTDPRHFFKNDLLFITVYEENSELMVNSRFKTYT